MKKGTTFFYKRNYYFILWIPFLYDDKENLKYYIRIPKLFVQKGTVTKKNNISRYKSVKRKLNVKEKIGVFLCSISKN